MPDEATAPIIPTRYKSDLAKGTSFFSGAQAISIALRPVPQFEHLSISFHNHFPPGRIREPGPLLSVQFDYRQMPPSLSSDDEDRWGWRGPKWEICVYPIPGTHRKVMRDYMDRTGFSMAAAWLKSSWLY